MKVKPLHDRVLLKRLDGEEKTSGGIIIPDSAQEAPIEALVVATGDGRIDDSGKVHPLSVKVGDKVIFSKYGGTDVKLDGVEHLIMREEDLLGIIES